MKCIQLWGVSQNNLKSIDVKIPLGSFTAICGPSGSGKSSLAFDTLYAEGQRRYIESLSNYTKQFLNKSPKPDMEKAKNIPPAISIEQYNCVKSSRSVVGTATEALDYLRIIYEKIGRINCAEHNIPLKKHSPHSAIDEVLGHFEGKRGYVLAPLYQEGLLVKGKKLFSELQKQGYLRIYLPASQKKKVKKTKSTKSTYWSEVSLGKVFSIEDFLLKKKPFPKDKFYIVIDRLEFNQEEKGRLVDSLTQAYQAVLKYNEHLLRSQVEVLTVDGENLFLSEHLSCSICQVTCQDVEAALFSFNNPIGACEKCKGFGNLMVFDENKVIPYQDMSLAQGAIKPFCSDSAREYQRKLEHFCKKKGIKMDVPWNELSKKHKDWVWKGGIGFKGIHGFFEYLERKKYQMHIRVLLSRYKKPSLCPQCKGSRLKDQANQVFVQGTTINKLSTLPITELLKWVKNLSLSPEEEVICKEPYGQLRSRLEFLSEVGLGYLHLNRSTKTLSGGEFQRLKLANQLGIGLSRVLYVLDEPTIGLHPRDNDRLIHILKKLNKLGNTLVVVEHDYDVINNSDYILEMGPQSGHLGGQVIYSGDKNNFYKCKISNTVGYLLAHKKSQIHRHPRPVKENVYKYALKLKGAKGNNLKNIDVFIPLKRLVTVTGVSGSGKSTLISGTLYPAVKKALGQEYLEEGHIFKDLKGVEYLRKVLFIDSSSASTTARSNPVTYLQLFKFIREIFAQTSDAKMMSLRPGSFSLNVEGGRCPMCQGLGYEEVDMVFMDDVRMSCELCRGKKYKQEILKVKFCEKNINDILNMTVAEAMEFFVAYPHIRRPLATLKEVGLSYITLGQPTRTLSGGESQRLKIARQLHLSEYSDTLYILDEPTTGLHFKEVHLLIDVLHKLVDSRASVLLIEHNQELILNSDWIIDIGPESGKKGGQVVTKGTPQDIMKSKKSITGTYLRKYCKQV